MARRSRYAPKAVSAWRFYRQLAPLRAGSHVCNFRSSPNRPQCDRYLVWRLALGVIFAYAVISKLMVLVFDATLLVPMRIRFGTYLGFKLPPANTSKTRSKRKNIEPSTHVLSAHIAAGGTTYHGCGGGGSFDASGCAGSLSGCF